MNYEVLRMKGEAVRQHPIKNIRSKSLGLVDAFGIKERFFLWREVVPGLIKLGIKAAGIAGVAGAADLLDLEEEGVAVAVDKPAEDLLSVAARFPLLPELFAGAAPVVHVAGLNGVLEGILVHPGHHDHTTAFLGAFLHDGGNQTASIEFQIQVHVLISERRRFRSKKNLYRGLSVAE